MTERRRPNRRLYDLQVRPSVRSPALQETTKETPRPGLKDSPRDRPTRSIDRTVPISDPRNVTKAELIERHAELKKKLQTLIAQRDAALEEENQLKEEIRNLSNLEEDSNDENSG
jgi:hypothetical protein